MGFVKVVKNKSYFKRFQVQYRRRREAKTDYYARKRLILQDKNKYKTPKYRFVVRVTNRDIITQIIAADLTHDVVLAAAYAHELPRYGIKLGLTNYAAAYATGLLLARRTLAKLGIAEKFAGVAASGEFKAVRTKKDDEEGSDEQFPFKAILDIGLARTTTGARIFGVMKGAVDGGIAVPHKPNRFPGFKKGKYDAKVHRERIFGNHVANYLKKVTESKDADAKATQFSRFVKAGIKPADIESMYKKVHDAIKKSPSTRVARKTDPKKAVHKSFKVAKITHAAKKAAVEKKVKALRAAIKA
jgi:large subunit ribosomal protein L5e